MTRTPDVVTLVSLDTHRLIVALPNRGPADVRSNLPRATAAGVLRHLADELDSEQLPGVPPAEVSATRTRRPARRHCPAEVARHAADTLAHHTRELAGMLATALDRGVPAGDVLDLAAARHARRTRRTRR
ncbi:hypothetical protein ACFXGI_06740 [Streptomyces sp. NPDC059355]|uniref:hypothetical protein n=1 Tax=Streptomyces sp. NPDC059355 TaxID=3346811 RepID=UPI0036B970D0